MAFLDIFALIVLVVLAAAVVAIWVILGMMPGKIARKRNHPQSEAINVCGWWGGNTLGILLPLAFIWAYTNPQGHRHTDKDAPEITRFCWKNGKIGQALKTTSDPIPIEVFWSSWSSRPNNPRSSFTAFQKQPAWRLSKG